MSAEQDSEKRFKEDLRRELLWNGLERYIILQAKKIESGQVSGYKAGFEICEAFKLCQSETNRGEI